MSSATADPAVVAAWLQANANSYVRAAKHFGITKAEARAMSTGRASRAPEAPEVRARVGKPPTELAAEVEVTALESIQWEMSQVLADIREYKQQDKATTAVSGLRRTYRELRKDLAIERDRLRLAGHRPETEQTPGELMAELREMVAACPEQVVEALEEAIELRRNPPDRLE